jgi:hypothetical protein
MAEHIFFNSETKMKVFNSNFIIYSFYFKSNFCKKKIKINIILIFLDHFNVFISKIIF